MKCFYHHMTDAVGICKNCNRGVCPPCAAEIADGLACRGVCETEAAAVSKLVRLNSRFVSEGPRGGTLCQGMGIAAIVAASPLLVRIFSSRAPSAMAIVPSLVLFFGGVGVFLYGWRINRLWRSTNTGQSGAAQLRR